MYSSSVREFSQMTLQALMLKPDKIEMPVKMFCSGRNWYHAYIGQCPARSDAGGEIIRLQQKSTTSWALKNKRVNLVRDRHCKVRDILIQTAANAPSPAASASVRT